MKTMKPSISRKEGQYTLTHDGVETAQVFLDGKLIRESWGGTASDLIHGRMTIEAYLEHWNQADRQVMEHLCRQQ
jgi:hypothetical protein